MKNPQHREHHLQRLEEFMKREEVIYEKMHHLQLPFSSPSFAHYMDHNKVQLTSYNMQFARRSRAAFQICSKFLSTRFAQQPILLILFLYENPVAYRIMFASTAQKIIEEHLISDWALCSFNYQYIIYSDAHQRRMFISSSIRAKPKVVASVTASIQPTSKEEKKES